MQNLISVNDVSITYDEHWARVTTNKTLLSFLAQPENGSLALANRILKEYQEKYHKPLNISQYSIAVEILIHAYLDVFAQHAKQLEKKLPKQISQQLIELMDKCQSHTEIIDIGELSVDNNRNVFDKLSEPIPRNLLFTLLSNFS